MLLLIGLLWLPGLCSAAAIPERTGIVTDRAGMLTSGEASELAREAESGNYRLYVLTIDSLNGESSATYAADVYDAWRLSGRDILLLLSSSDQQAELSFINPQLQSALDSWSSSSGAGTGSAAVKQVIDTYFIPHAKSGDFAGGIKALAGALDDIGSGRQDIGGGGQGAANSTAGSFPLGTIAALLIGVLILGVIAYVAISGSRLRRQLSGRREQIGDLLVRANRALDSLKPFQGIVQGKTGEMAEGISSRLSNALIELSALNSENQGELPAFWKLGALRTVIGVLQEKEDSYRSLLEGEEKQIAVISEADRGVKAKINELKQDMPELNEDLQETLKETGFGLQEIAEDLKELSEETDKADQLELFDPVAVQELAGEAQAKQEQIERDIQDVEVYRNKLRQFPERLAAARARIAELIQANSLQNMKVKPYDNLESASSRMATLEAPLSSGMMDEVRSISAAVDVLVEEAVAMTERQARLRESNRSDLETARSGFGTLRQRRSELQSRISEAGRRFDSRHIASPQTALDEWSRRIAEAEGELPRIEALTSDERGEFEQARTALDRLLALQEEGGHALGGAADAVAGLGDRLNRVSAALQEGESRLEAARMQLRSKGLSLGGGLSLSSVPGYRELQSGLSAAPFNLDELEAAAGSYTAQVAQIADEAARLIRRREEEERRAQMAMLEEQARRQQRPPGTPPFGGGGFGGGGDGFGGGGGRSGGGGHSGGGGGRSSGGSSWGGGGKSGGGSKW
ncbi:TPM domain-containing protein [Paenibacillus stellifer]|nr:TPM domain-containing protein [Paenibacillus stellifer]